MVYEKQEKHHNIQNVKKFKNMPKPEIHPNWFSTTPVICEGRTLCSIGSTKPKLQVDVWLGNHPFYTAVFLRHPPDAYRTIFEAHTKAREDEQNLQLKRMAYYSPY